MAFQIHIADSERADLALFSNSAALITDAFPANERGKALGINQVAALAGSLLGFVLGGILAVFDWRYVFLISVPVGLFGTAWSYWKLRELAVIKKNQKIDVWGNVTFGVGLTILLISLTYGMLPFGNSAMGWGDPYVVTGLVVSCALLIGFPFIERHVKDPMFKLQLFKNRMFAAGNFASFLASISRGGVMLMLVILLQGIWLPLHGFAFEDTPFWAGIYMIPMTIGFALMGPLSGWLSDRFGARGFSTLGMLLAAGIFLTLTTLPYQFNYIFFALGIFGLGVSMGMFASPNTASIMNAVPPEDRGAASGMRATLQNTGSTVGLSILFTIVLFALSGNLGHGMSIAAANAGAAQLAPILDAIPPTGALFAAFLGYNPMSVMLKQLPLAVTSSLSAQSIAELTSTIWFPTAIAPSFMSALDIAFYFNAGLAVIAAAASALRGIRYVYTADRKALSIEVPATTKMSPTSLPFGNAQADPPTNARNGGSKSKDTTGNEEAARK